MLERVDSGITKQYKAQELQDHELQDQETERRQGWVSIFQEFDTNDDGELCKEEIKYLMRVCGTDPTDEEVNEYIRAADKNDDMLVSCEEFCLFMEKQYALGEPIQKLREAFDWYDKDKNGYIERDEMKAILKDCGEKNPNDEALIDAVIESADRNGDGKIDLDEFVKKMHNHD